MKNTSASLLACLLLLFAAPAWPVEQLTLAEALAATLGERLMLQASAADVTAAAAEAELRSSRYLPRLNLSERFVRTDEPGGSLFIDLNQRRFELRTDADAYNQPPARSNFETRLTLSQPLYDPDLKFDRSSALLKHAAAGAMHTRHREEAVMATLLAYLDVQQGHARLKWAEQSLEEADELLATARQRENAGLGLYADTLRGEVLRNDSRRQLLVAGNALLSAQRRLALAIGRADGRVDIAGPAQIAFAEAPAAARRGDLVAMARNVAAAELAARQQKAAYLPRVGLQAAYFRNDRDLAFADNADAWSISAGLEWLLFDGGERSRALAGARARHLALALQQQEQARQARLAVVEARQAVEEAVFRLELVESSLAAAEASRALTAERYAAGLATLADLLAVQTELARVRSDLAAATTGLLVARADVHYAQGSLLPALLPERGSPP